MERLISCEVWCLDLLGFLGSCQDQLWILYSVGEIGLKSICNLTPLCLMWCLWREQNRRTFEDMESSDDQLLASFNALCLTGLGLGDSPLVILSLCSLALSCVLIFFSSSSFYLFTLSFSFIFFSLPYVFLHKVVYLNIYLYYLSKNKKIMFFVM